MTIEKSIASSEIESPELALDYLAKISNKLPVVKHVIEHFGEASVKDYLEQIVQHAPNSYQSPQDLADIVEQYAAPLLGSAVAKLARAELTRCPVVLTANHHGVDSFAQSVQGTLLFSLQKIASGVTSAVVPVFACGNVPMNNLTYPRGLMHYATGAQSPSNAPTRLPIFSTRVRRKTVSWVNGFDAEMVKRAEKSAARMARNNEISDQGFAVFQEILQQDYMAPEVLDCQKYSDQAVILNHRIWQRLFDHPSTHLLYLELERVVEKLLQRDLSDCHSLAYLALFHPLLQGLVYQELDTIQGCWDRQALERRWESREGQSAYSQGCGTYFFWGIDSEGHRIPLIPVGLGTSNCLLRGVGDKGSIWEIPLQPEAIKLALAQGRLLPSVFTCLMDLALARGVTCLGGYYQAEYLPAMQQGMIRALNQCEALEHIIEPVKKAITGSYLSGMQAVMQQATDQGLLPAGPLEIIKAGGLSQSDIEAIAKMTIKGAHIASLFETVTDVMPETLKLPDWWRDLSIECNHLIQEQAVLV